MATVAEAEQSIRQAQQALASQRQQIETTYVEPKRTAQQLRAATLQQQVSYRQAQAGRVALKSEALGKLKTSEEQFEIEKKNIESQIAAQKAAEAEAADWETARRLIIEGKAWTTEGSPLAGKVRRLLQGKGVPKVTAAEEIRISRRLQESIVPTETLTQIDYTSRQAMASGKFDTTGLTPAQAVGQQAKASRELSQVGFIETPQEEKPPILAASQGTYDDLIKRQQEGFEPLQGRVIKFKNYSTPPLREGIIPTITRQTGIPGVFTILKGTQVLKTAAKTITEPAKEKIGEGFKKVIVPKISSLLIQTGIPGAVTTLKGGQVLKTAAKTITEPAVKEAVDLGGKVIKLTSVEWKQTASAIGKIGKPVVKKAITLGGKGFKKAVPLVTPFSIRQTGIPGAVVVGNELLKPPTGWKETTKVVTFSESRRKEIEEYLPRKEEIQNTIKELGEAKDKETQDKILAKLKSMGVKSYLTEGGKEGDYYQFQFPSWYESSRETKNMFGVKRTQKEKFVPFLSREIFTKSSEAFTDIAEKSLYKTMPMDSLGLQGIKRKYSLYNYQTPSKVIGTVGAIGLQAGVLYAIPGTAPVMFLGGTAEASLKPKQFLQFAKEEPQEIVMAALYGGSKAYQGYKALTKYRPGIGYVYPKAALKGNKLLPSTKQKYGIERESFIDTKGRELLRKVGFKKYEEPLYRASDYGFLTSKQTGKLIKGLGKVGMKEDKAISFLKMYKPAYQVGTYKPSSLSYGIQAYKMIFKAAQKDNVGAVVWGNVQKTSAKTTSWEFSRSYVRNLPRGETTFFRTKSDIPRGFRGLERPSIKPYYAIEKSYPVGIKGLEYKEGQIYNYKGKLTNQYRMIPIDKKTTLVQQTMRTTNVGRAKIQTTIIKSNIGKVSNKLIMESKTGGLVIEQSRPGVSQETFDLGISYLDKPKGVVNAQDLYYETQKSIMKEARMFAPGKLKPLPFETSMSSEIVKFAKEIPAKSIMYNKQTSTISGLKGFVQTSKGTTKIGSRLDITKTGRTTPKFPSSPPPPAPPATTKITKPKIPETKWVQVSKDVVKSEEPIKFVRSFKPLTSGGYAYTDDYSQVLVTGRDILNRQLINSPVPVMVSPTLTKISAVTPQTFVLTKTRDIGASLYLLKTLQQPALPIEKVSVIQITPTKQIQSQSPEQPQRLIEETKQILTQNLTIDTVSAVSSLNIQPPSQLPQQQDTKPNVSIKLPKIKVPLFKLTTSEDGTIRNLTSGGITEAFDVQVRRGGKFVTISKKPLPKGKGLKLGAEKVLETLAATFRLKRKGVTLEKDIRYNLSSKSFRTPKVGGEMPLTFVEKKSQRLKKGTKEISEILTIRGGKKGKSKSKKSRKLKWF